VAVKKAIIDANVLLALVDKKDKWHPEAKTLAEALKKRKWEVIYLDCVLNEVISVLAKRLEERDESQGLAYLLERLEKLVPKEKVEWLYPGVPDLYSDIVKLIKEKG
jgi:predicted nucleic acid-binding protein